MNCEILATFAVNPNYLGSLPRDFVVDDEISLKKVFSLSEDGKVRVNIYIRKYVFQNSNLNVVNELKAPELKEICVEYGIKYAGVNDTKSPVQQYIKDHFNDLPKEVGWYEIKWGDISEYLPIFEYYDSSSYGNPIKVIESTLKSIYRSFFYDTDENGIETLKPELHAKRGKTHWVNLLELLNAPWMFFYVFPQIHLN